MQMCLINVHIYEQCQAILSTISELIEGFPAKRAYIAFLADFHFLQDQANFWQTDLFWQEKLRSVIFLVDLRFVFEK